MRRGTSERSLEADFEVTPFHLTVLSFTLVGVLHHSLKGVFALIEKAHEHLRESERLRGGAELVKGTGA